MSTDDDQQVAASAPTTAALVCLGSFRQHDPPIFSGTDDKDVKDWLDEYNRVSKYNKWDNAHKLTVVQFYLTGVGSLWYRNLETSPPGWPSKRRLRTCLAIQHFANYGLNSACVVGLSRMVTHNGQVKRFGELYRDVSSYHFARFSVTNDMSPSVRVLVYAFHEGHLLADSLVIEVEEACLEKAAVSTLLFILVDRPQMPTTVSSSEFQRLKRSVESDTASTAFLDECCSLARRPDRFQRSCRARAVIVRLYISGQKGKLCADAFWSCCLLPFGDIEPDFSRPLSPLPNRGRPFFSLVPDVDYLEIDGRIGQKPKLTPALGLQPNFDEEDEYDEAHDLPPDSVIRKDFRETWIFDERVIGLDGVADIATSLPHSITTWSVQAVSVAPSGGVCIPQPREVRAFQLFFLQVVLPYSVVRKEQIEVLATVYNYCNVYVYGLEGVCTGTQEGERSERRAVSVSASSASSLTFPVVPLREGLFTIKVHAHCNQSSGHSPGTHDVVEKKLHVVVRATVYRCHY
ncbi:hypothetical protein HPB51_020940 [Rhipicephalus microplus]|uniref:Alpha-2-macroglobulin domain-containing protein n=1 Tax=Rhipicephalus microplus TaxID=6941 RepID=A0A9J6EBV1_RHIMP|nr:hypothetical protein HPB51_020940 [Rhipicephalus microplus]